MSKLPPFHNGVRVVPCYSWPEPMVRIDVRRDGQTWGKNVTATQFRDDPELRALVDG